MGARLDIVDGRPFTSAAFVTAARSYLGTPYADGGRQRGVSCDCIGLPVMASRDVGGMAGDVWGYSNMPRRKTAQDAADAYLAPVLTGEALQRVAKTGGTDVFRPGLIALFWVQDQGNPQHFAVIGEHPLLPGTPTMIHAHQSAKAVVEATLSSFWRRRVVTLYRHPMMLED